MRIRNLTQNLKISTLVGYARIGMRSYRAAVVHLVGLITLSVGLAACGNDGTRSDTMRDQQQCESGTMTCPATTTMPLPTCQFDNNGELTGTARIPGQDCVLSL